MRGGPKKPVWVCQESGDCCLSLTSIVLSIQELEAMRAARPEVPIAVEGMPGHPNLVRLIAPKGCPYLGRQLDGRSTCTVYKVRPYNCRRFMCGRTDVSKEPFRVGGPLGCRNLSERLQTGYQFAAFYRSNQRRAQRLWAEDMGWSE